MRVERAIPSQVGRFAVVGISGIVVNQAIFSILTESIGFHYAFAAVLATQGSTAWNYLGTENWVFIDRRSHSARRRFLSFLALNNAQLLLRIPMLALLAEIVGMHVLLANLVTLVSLFALRFVVSRQFIWSGDQSEQPVAPEEVQALRAGADDRIQRGKLVAVGPGPAGPFLYDIAGILRLDSDVELPELRYFRTEQGANPDLQITTKTVGALPHVRTHFHREGATLSYEEHLGRGGANFRLIMGEPIRIEVSPLLARSRHVLYTNVVEALLRFLLVSKGYVLLHSACVVVNGMAVLLSAQTDTGKTSTVIRLVRERGYGFLSDDMIVLSADGRAIGYPKPMTLSYHTMSAIAGVELNYRQRAALALQSRLHSKSGRSVGQFLGGRNLPIMSINSLVQIMVPPPKYHIDSLFACEVGGEAPIGHVVILERGDEDIASLAPSSSVAALIANTDDAYGFPPFATFAPHMLIGGDDYATLRDRERTLLLTAIGNAQVWRLRVPGHGWAEILPDLIEGRVRIGDEHGRVVIPISQEHEPAQAAADAG